MIALTTKSKLHNITTPTDLLPQNKADVITHSQQIITGIPATIAIKYKDGILIAANPVSRSGRTLKSRNVNRFSYIGTHMVFSGSGDHSDFQKLSELLDKQWHKDSLFDDLEQPNVEVYSHYLSQLCYQKRNKLDPYMVSSVLAGFDNEGKQRLFSINQYGAKLEEDYFTTGFGSYMLPPVVGKSNMIELIIRKFKRKKFG